MLKINLDKKLFIILSFIVFLSLLIVILILTLKKDGIILQESYDGDRFIDEYSELNGVPGTGTGADELNYPTVKVRFENIKYITVEDLLKLLEPNSGLDGTGAVYIGYPECVYCRSAVQVLLDTAKDKNLDKIYYLNIDEVWDIYTYGNDNKLLLKQKEHPKYYELLDKLGDDYIEDYVISNASEKEINLNKKRIKAPLVLFIVDGMVVSSHAGTFVSQSDPFVPLVDEQVDVLTWIYGHGIDDVIDGIKDLKK